jgi:uncharacterized protein (DUF488 family)
LISLLKENGITLLADVRSAPYSRFNPQFNKEDLEFSLRSAGIAYVYKGKQLGGRPTEPSCYKSQKLPAEDADYFFEVDYPEVMKKDWFLKGIDHLFDLMQVEMLVDIRLRPGGQLAGFAKQEDLPYFLDRLAGGCQYLHLPELAPTKEIVDGYRADHNWPKYELQFGALMDERHVPQSLERDFFERYRCCLLCSEATPEKCQRRLVAERLAAHWPVVEIDHL